MRQLAQETGGRSFFPNRIEDLNGVYGQIADELSSQYTIGYTSKNPLRNGAWRRLVVQVHAWFWAEWLPWEPNFQRVFGYRRGEWTTSAREFR